MKLIPPFLLLLLTGCQQATPSPLSSPPPAEPPPPVVQNPPTSNPPDSVLERKVRQQAQYIDALISQNEALAARATATPDAPPYPSPVARALARPLAATPAKADPSPEKQTAEATMLTPNADGVIDVAAALASLKRDEIVNPFAVRMVPAESVRELSVQVGGIVAGPVACAVINDKLVQAGDSIESLTLERIESDAVILRHGTARMRLPLGARNLRLRLPI